MQRSPHILRLLTIATIVTTLWTGLARGQDIPAPEKVVSIEGITEYRYPNGLRFLSYPDPSSPTVTVNMTVLVGSRHEGYGESGMAHLLEHMLFKGSKLYPDSKSLDGPDELLRDPAGQREEPRVRHPHGSRPAAQRVHQAR